MSVHRGQSGGRRQETEKEARTETGPGLPAAC